MQDDWLAEDRAAQDVADRPVGRLPHLLEIEFLYARFVRRNRRALDGDAVFLRRLGAVDRDLIVGGVAMLNAKVKIFEVDVEVGVDQLLFDVLPDDAGHLVAVHFDDRIGRL